MNKNTKNERNVTYRLSRLAFGLFALAGLIVFTPDVSAQLSYSGSVGGAPSVPGVSYVNFDNANLGNATVTTYDGVEPISGTTGDPTLSVSFTGTGQVVNGISQNVYAPPFLSGSNGTNFGNGPGADTTNYISAGIDSAILNFTTPQQYLGILWGSIDSYNSLSFFDASFALIGSITGTDILAGANGDQGLNGTLYVNINSTTPFTYVVASSSQYAFEFDNVAFASFAVGVPEPATYAMLLSALLTVGLFKNRRKVTA